MSNRHFNGMLGVPFALLLQVEMIAPCFANLTLFSALSPGRDPEEAPLLRFLSKCSHSTHRHPTSPRA